MTFDTRENVVNYILLYLPWRIQETIATHNKNNYEKEERHKTVTAIFEKQEIGVFGYLNRPPHYVKGFALILISKRNVIKVFLRYFESGLCYLNNNQTCIERICTNHRVQIPTDANSLITLSGYGLKRKRPRPRVCRVSNYTIVMIIGRGDSKIIKHDDEYAILYWNCGCFVLESRQQAITS